MGGTYPVGGGYGGGGVTGSGDLSLPPPEHNHTVHYDKAHYGPVYGDGEASRVKVGQSVVVARRIGLVGDADESLGVRTEGWGGGGVDRQYKERCG